MNVKMFLALLLSAGGEVNNGCNNVESDQYRAQIRASPTSTFRSRATKFLRRLEIRDLFAPSVFNPYSLVAPSINLVFGDRSRRAVE